MYEEIAEAVETRMNTEWTTLHPTINVFFDSTNQQTDNEDSFVDFTILFGEARRMNIGISYRNHRCEGIININIYVKKGEGTRTALSYADDIAGIFRDKLFSGILCKSPSIKRLGEELQWFVYNVSVPFQADFAYTS